MDIQQLLGILSGVIASTAFIPYVISIARKKTKPHPISWVLWTIIGGFILVSYWGVGARETIWLALINFLGPLTITILSIKYWDRGFSRFDYTCLSMSAASIVLWIVFRSASLALTFNILADMLAATPTLRKVWNDPSTESPSAWGIFIIGNLLSVAAIKTWSYGVALLPVYLTCLSISIALIALFRRKLIK